jgi:UDP-N-acetylmuramate--alanine ligase
VTAESLAERLRSFGHRGVHYTGTIEQSAARVLAEARTGDLVVTLGAGNVWQAGDLLIELLAGRV